MAIPARMKRRPGATAPEGDVAAPAAQARDLSDAQVQTDIQEPGAATATIGGEEIELHPLAMKRARQFVGLVTQILAEVSGKPGAMGLRISGVLLENEGYSSHLAGFGARAQSPAAELVPDVLINERAKAIDDTATPTELAVLFTKMMDQNRVFETFGVGPK